GQSHESVGAHRFGELQVDEGKHQVLVSGRVVELTVKEFDLLCALMKAKGRVLSRDQILETVWGYSNAVEIESRTVDVHVRRLREKLTTEQFRIVTVKGVGYRFDVETP
ncbi:MAG: winged helix-turn-helix transcriptional regulator, partial [Nitrospira sp.]|nr:winged helix-turn-helix transcriptional regulator [Nitrospira sp.]